MIGAAINELLQAINGACVYPGRAGQTRYPLIIYAMSRHERSLNIDASNPPRGTYRTSYDIDVLAKTYTEGETIMRNLIDAYQGWNGIAFGIDIALIEVQADAVVYEDAESVWAFPISMTVHH